MSYAQGDAEQNGSIFVIANHFHGQLHHLNGSRNRLMIQQSHLLTLLFEVNKVQLDPTVTSILPCPEGNNLPMNPSPAVLRKNNLGHNGRRNDSLN